LFEEKGTKEQGSSSAEPRRACMKNSQRQPPDPEKRDHLERAVRALAESTGLGFTYEPESSAGDHPDGYIRVPGTGAEDELWPLEVKRHLSNTTLGPASRWVWSSRFSLAKC